VKTITTMSVARRLLFGLSAAALVASGVHVGAQTMEPAATAAEGQGTITVPQDVQIFGKNDPNHRRATAVVNGDIITGTDVEQRLALLLSASQAKPSDEELGRLRLQILRNLIDETLQIQEAKAQDLKVDDDDVESSYQRVAQQNFRQDTKALDAYLEKIGSSPASLKRQIRGELAWQAVLRRNVQPFVNVSESEVRESMDRLKAAKGTEEYRVGEIFLAATAENRPQVAQNAKQIMEQVQKGGSFVAYARQYSQASTAAVGGELGWIRLAQLPNELATAVQGLQTGQLVGPVETSGGFSILYLIDKRQVLTADPRDALLALKQISIDFPAGTTEPQATKRAAEFAAAMKAARGCGNVDAVAQQLGAQVVANDQVRARDLPEPLQQALLALSLGETSPPFGSIKEGVRVLMLCGRDDPKVDNGPSFDQMMSQIEDDRVNKRAQAYLRDLRRDAVIDYN